MQESKQFNYQGMFWLVIALAVMLFILTQASGSSGVAGVTNFLGLTDSPP